jgi:hypothetical protein
MRFGFKKRRRGGMAYANVRTAKRLIRHKPAEQTEASPWWARPIVQRPKPEGRK